MKICKEDTLRNWQEENYGHLFRHKDTGVFYLFVIRKDILYFDADNRTTKEERKYFYVNLNTGIVSTYEPCKHDSLIDVTNQYCLSKQ